MNEELLRKFCESRHRWLIVTAVTFVVGLLLVLPIVDVYYAGLDEKSALATELDSARVVASEIKVFESRYSERQGQLAALEARAVDDGSLPALRGKLLEMAKEARCSIRRLSVGATVARPWLVDDDPLAVKWDAQNKEARKTTGFALEWRPVTLSLSGTSADLRALVERLMATGMFMHTKTLEMFPSSPSRQSLTLDLELWYYTLKRIG
jgi:hypothetical protein